jgi:FOG: Ankyrin repeat
MDDTEHNIRGKGILASKKDVFTDPDEFAAGCKLLQAAALADVQGIQNLLALRPNHINFRDYDRRTALHVAASEGKLDIVKLLVERYNAPINRSDRWGGSPLDDAHRHRHVEVIQYLRSKGASTGSTDLTTNLITAAAGGDLDDLQMLLNSLDGSQKSNSQKGNSQKGLSQSKGISQRIKVVNGILGASSGSKSSAAAAAAAAALKATKIDIKWWRLRW